MIKKLKFWLFKTLGRLLLPADYYVCILDRSNYLLVATLSELARDNQHLAFDLIEYLGPEKRVEM